MTDWPADTLPSMALWLARHMHQIRRHEAAADIVAEVTAAVRQAVHVVDLPPGRVYAGPCDCGTHLYGHPGRQLVTCPTCGTTWGIPERQEWMRSRLADQLVGAYEASLMLSGIGIYVADGTIRVWASRRKLERRPSAAADPRYRFGDIVDLALARDTRAGLAMNAIVLRGDARRLPLPDASVDLIVTSPPYFGLRSYTDNVKCLKCIDMERDGRDPRQAWPDYDAHVREVHIQHYGGQIGSEATPQEWVAALVECTREWMRVLKPSGSMFVNLGDKYAVVPQAWRAETDSRSWSHANEPRRLVTREGQGNIRPKSLLGLPWRYALACTDQLGLILRRDIVWAKPNGLPESVTDRCRSSHEYLFHLVRQPRYYAAVDEIREEYEPDSAERKRRYGNNPGRDGLAGLRATTPHRHGINGASAMGVGGAAMNPLGKLPGSVWKIDPGDTVWDIASQPLVVPPHLGVDHFAAYPLELPRRCVLGWSPPGICTSCGEGRRPVASAAYTVQDRLPDRRGATMAANGSGTPGSGQWDMITRQHGRASRQTAITGYACACTPHTDREHERPGRSYHDHSQDESAGNHRAVGMSGTTNVTVRETVREYGFDGWTPPPTRPAIVLDPFMGTGTTLLAASALGRVGIGVDLSADYCRLARWRVNDPGERAKAMQVPKPPPVPDGMEALF